MGRSRCRTSRPARFTDTVLFLWVLRVLRVPCVLCAFSKAPDLVLGQLPPGADFQSRVADRADRDALQARDRMADAFAHLADLPVASLVQRDLQRRFVCAA